MTDTSDTTPGPEASPTEWEALANARRQFEAELLQLNKAVLFDALAQAGVTHEGLFLPHATPGCHGHEERLFLIAKFVEWSGPDIRRAGHFDRSHIMRDVRDDKSFNARLWPGV